MLTLSNYQANLFMHSQKTSAGRGNPKNKGCKAANHAVFYCPLKTKAGLPRFKHVMTGCYRRLRPAVPLFGISTLFQPVTHSVERISDGLQLNKGVSIMLKSHTQKLTNHVSKKFTSRFNVLTRSGRSIARKIPFKEAIRLKNAQPELFIKFDSMVGAL